MIASLKVGYKAIMLGKLLDTFDSEGGFEGAAKERKQQKRGCRGLDFGGKATILDAMNILKEIWSRDGKYAREGGIRRCWKKANILPIDMQTEISQDLGSLSVPMKDKTLTKEESSELCNLMKALQVKTKDGDLNVDSVAIALQDSFADEQGFTDSDFADMADTWVGVEDVPEVLEAVVEEEVELAEAATQPTEEELANQEDSEPAPAVAPELDSSDKLTFQDIEGFLTKTSLNCERLGVPQSATVHLDRFRKAVRDAKLNKTKRKTFMDDYFQKKPKKD